jgi:hypothetical protein
MVLNVVMENTTGQLPSLVETAEWGEYHTLTYPVLADDWQFKSQYLLPVEEAFSSYIFDAEGKVAWVEYGESNTTDVRARAQLELMLQ